MDEHQDSRGIDPIAAPSDRSDALAWALLSAPLPDATRLELLELEERYTLEKQLICAALGVPPKAIKAMPQSQYQYALALAQAVNSFGAMADAMMQVVLRCGIEMARILASGLGYVQPVMAGLDWGKWAESTAERRARKAARRARRKAFMASGKHGLKRPKGKRNVSRN